LSLNQNSFNQYIVYTFYNIYVKKTCYYLKNTGAYRMNLICFKKRLAGRRLLRSRGFTRLPERRINRLDKSI